MSYVQADEDLVLVVLESEESRLLAENNEDVGRHVYNFLITNGCMGLRARIIQNKVENRIRDSDAFTYQF
jgi:hypothetical protein